MMKPTLQEVHNAVTTLNGQIDEAAEDSSLEGFQASLVQMVTDGDRIAVTFFSVPLWESEQDDRPFVDKEGEEETRIKQPLLNYLREAILDVFCAIKEISERLRENEGRNAWDIGDSEKEREMRTSLKVQAGLQKLLRRWKRQGAKYTRSSIEAAGHKARLHDSCRYEGIALGYLWSGQDLEKEIKKDKKL